MQSNLPIRVRRAALSSMLAVAFPLATRLAAQTATPAAGARPDSGVYTADQATRGEQLFGPRCLECHARNDMSNPDFRLKWNGRSVFDLFERIRTTMPDVAPGSLPRDEYVDVVAYMLKLNGVPAGPTSFFNDSTALSKAVLNLGSPPSGSAPASVRSTRPRPHR